MNYKKREIKTHHGIYIYILYQAAIKLNQRLLRSSTAASQLRVLKSHSAQLKTPARRLSSPFLQIPWRPSILASLCLLCKTLRSIDSNQHSFIVHHARSIPRWLRPPQTPPPPCQRKREKFLILPLFCFFWNFLRLSLTDGNDFRVRLGIRPWPIRAQLFCR